MINKRLTSRKLQEPDRHGAAMAHGQRRPLVSCGGVCFRLNDVDLLPAGSSHQAVVGGHDNGHSHLQAGGVFLLSAPHLDEPHQVQVSRLFSRPTARFCRVTLSRVSQ